MIKLLRQIAQLKTENDRLKAKVSNLETETAHQKALIVSTIERVDIASKRIDYIVKSLTS